MHAVGLVGMSRSLAPRTRATRASTSRRCAASRTARDGNAPRPRPPEQAPRFNRAPNRKPNQRPDANTDLQALQREMNNESRISTALSQEECSDDCGLSHDREYTPSFTRSCLSKIDPRKSILHISWSPRHSRSFEPNWVHNARDPRPRPRHRRRPSSPKRACLAARAFRPIGVLC